MPEPNVELRETLSQKGNDHFESVREEMMQKSGRPVTTSCSRC